MKAEIKIKTMGNIFEELFKKDICFAVCISNTKLKTAEFGFTESFIGKDYFLVVKNRDVKSIDNWRKSKSSLKSHRTVELNLNQIDVRAFKKIQDKFVKVVHGNDGRVYELKGNSFKDYIEE